MPINDVSIMKVADLKRELKVRGLPITGNKNELQERLQAAMEGEPLLEDSSLVGEDILDEEGVLSDEEKILGSDENELLKSPASTPITILPKPIDGGNKASAGLEDDILESSTTVTKKIVLKRKSSFSSTASINANNITAKENTEPSPKKATKMSERNPITIDNDKKVSTDQTGTAAIKKLTELTMQERLELRAKKFGIETKSSAGPGIMSKEKNSAISTAPVVSSEKQVELLKKRAERFGCVTSTNLAKLDAEERLLKRKQRFGGETELSTKTKAAFNEHSLSTVPIKSASDNDEWAEKARKRLERFKGSATPAVSVDAAIAVSSTAAATNSA